MQKHPYFDLEILENEEIEDYLSAAIQQRKTLQEWPLSCVELIEMSNQCLWVIKSQREPCTLEGKFYQRITHPSVVKPVLILDNPPNQIIIYPYQNGIHPAELNLTYEEALIFYHKIRVSIDAFDRRGLPYRLDISTPFTFDQCFTQTSQDLRKLISAEEFTQCQPTQVDLLLQVIHENRLLEKWFLEIGYAHYDLASNNILIHDNSTSFTILDWQRPVWGPILLDEYHFLTSLGFSVSPAHTIMALLERIQWLTECTLRWFPPGRVTYDHTIHQSIIQIETAYRQFSSQTQHGKGS